MPIFAVTLFAAILRAYSVSKPFTGDEMTAYIFFLRGGWNTIFQAWSDPYPPFLIDVANHPVNNILTYLSINSFSEVSVWSLRLPAFLFGCLTIPLTYALGFQCTRSRRAALFGALGLALANGHVQWSGISRGYSTMMFFEVALLLALLYFQRNRSISIGIAIVFSGVLMVYSQFVSLAVLASLVTAIAFFALTKKSFSDGADSRLRYIASNAMLFFLIGIGTAIIYSPQFSVSETLLSVLREGKLPKETFGQIPGFGSERVTTKHPNPTWEQVSLFVMGAGPVMGFILAGFWLVGLVLLAKRNIHAACMLGSLAFVPLLMILITQSFPRGRYLLFTLPAYVIPIGYLIDHGLLRIHRWLDGASKNRDTPLKFAAGIIGVSLIFVLNFPATLAHVQNPRPDRSGSWNLNDAEVFLQQQAKGDDLI